MSVSINGAEREMLESTATLAGVCNSAVVRRGIRLASEEAVAEAMVAQMEERDPDFHKFVERNR